MRFCSVIGNVCKAFLMKNNNIKILKLFSFNIPEKTQSEIYPVACPYEIVLLKAWCGIEQP